LNGSEAERRLGLFTVPFGVPVLPALARDLLARHPDPQALSRVLVLLPSARARRGLIEAFLAETGGRALLLPRISAVGDVDEDDAFGRFEDEAGDIGDEPPPAMAPLARRLALGRLLLDTMAGGAAVSDRLARDLARVIDTLAAHDADPAQLADILLPELSAHRERGLRVLAAICEHWPALLRERGLTDPARRREALLNLLAARWAAVPPAHPVVAAGFASAPPAVARLLARIARLPLGSVLLPGLDPSMDAATWAAIGGAPTHPLHGIHAILEAMGATPSDAGLLAPAPDARGGAFLAAFRPAAVAAPPASPPPSGISLLEVAGPEAEALAIALAMRRVLETPGKTAALVTRSRGLARRVAAALGRWGLQVDDSAGEPLSLRPPGVLLLAVLEAMVEGFRPVSLLATLKHPLVRAETADARARWLSMVRRLDLDLRGPAPPAGLDGIAGRIRDDATRAWWTDEAAPTLAPLEPLFEAAPSLSALAEALCGAAGALAGDRMWAGPDGRALGALLQEIIASPDAARLRVARDEAGALVRALLQDTPVRPPWRSHPRLQILGPLEARLAHADLLILGDLNEGSWPSLPAPDPWMAPSVRKALGLPPAEARIGLEAHDLLGALAAPDLLLTRARRDASGLKVPSRFLLRLQATFGDLPRDLELEAALAIDGTGRTERLRRPEPAPPSSERPRLLRVTEADMLAADPFSFYARRMLLLNELDPLEQQADAAAMGSAVHRILERLVTEPETAPDRQIDEELVRAGIDPARLLLWRPRVERMVEWVRTMRASQPEWEKSWPEQALTGEVHGIAIRGRADRIDRHADGHLRIIDYKRGPVPKKTAFVEGQKRQLPLLRLLVEATAPDGEFGGRQVACLEYWIVSGGSEPGTIVGGKWPIDRETFEQELRKLFDRHLFGTAPFIPKLNPVFASGYRTYDQLARIEEWL
jgi:ATP-dependent helicase/nuclease subunit B